MTRIDDLCADPCPVKEEPKKDDDTPEQQEASNRRSRPEAEHSRPVKSEDERYGRKRPHDDGRGHAYYEHRDDRR